MERPRTRALLIDDEAGSGSETTAHDIEKLSVSVRTHRRSPPAPRPASHAGRAPPCARMRDLATIKSPGGAAQPALARGADGAGAGAVQAGHHLRPLGAVWSGCIGPATPPPASGVDLGSRSRPLARHSTGLAPRWRPLAPLFLLSDSSLVPVSIGATRYLAAAQLVLAGAATLRRVRLGVGRLSARVLGSPAGASIHVLWWFGDPLAFRLNVSRHSFL
jgi:hypothetical protein